MPKVTLDMNAFKALASDTRLSILRALDGKKLNLKELCNVTKLNKATLHEHLVKLNEAGLVKKKERDGHKWVYYRLTWRGEGLLHPENTRIVVMFSTTFVSLLLAVILMVNFLQPIPVGIAETVDDTTYLYQIENNGIPLFERSYSLNYIGETDAREKTVSNITTELQVRAPLRNSIGENFDDEDIVWVEKSASAPSCDLKVGSVSGEGDDSSESIPSHAITFDCYSNIDRIANSQVILYQWADVNLSFYGVNESANESDTNDYDDANETPDEKGLEENTTNSSYYLFDGNGRSSEFYPAVPHMIATVQDETLLYLAAICLTFFGVLFALSSWRFWINRKPKL